MVSIRRVIKWCGLAALGLAATGCIVLPYGAGRRHGGGDRHYVPQSEAQPIMRGQPQGPSHRGGR